MTQVVIIASHPDDAELSMGGTIIKMIESDWKVIIVDLTDGEPTPFGTKELRQQEMQQAKEIMGVEQRICLNMPNRYLQANLENRHKLAQIIREYQPDLLFGPVMPDHHPDHVATSRLLEAARFEAKFHKTDLEGSPHWVPKLYQYYSTHRNFYEKPSFIIDVTEQWDKKTQAIQAYQSQIKNVLPDQISIVEKVEIIGRYFGQSINTIYGEPFFSSEPLGFKNLSGVLL